MNGVVFQISTISTAIIAVSGEAVQAMGSVIRPRPWSMSLMMPNWSCSIQAHIRADTMVGMAQGISTAARTKPRPLNSWCRTSAMMRPKTVSKLTDTTVKRIVFHTARHQRGSASTP
jgi:hypothetical protein